ncbi:PREDICTED: nucleolar protein 12-like [Dufourea novaeangliae]|uniref:RNA-binding protein 34 n=1 Tax=Dufourea novaeangliae TaxID=178035 RepID=A0A154P326_DUFNO|nr:PREDICTED: nucleolar protein 12-like [Dufourea novaeangliae]KZC06257.1 RNA-binding protein 34 [Dufourea novaeangliae]
MVKVVSDENKDQTNNLLRTPKDGFIHKKKNEKFKQTPTGKVMLVNGSKTSNSSSNVKQQKRDKQKSTLPQKTSDQNKELKKKNPPKSDKKQQETSKNLKQKNEVQSEEDDSDSDEDINEGILLEEHNFMRESNGSEDEEDSDEAENKEENIVPNILGASLADDSDESDEDYTEDEEEVQINKGVKMFKGLKSKDESNDSSKDSSDNSGIESVDDDDEDSDQDLEANDNVEGEGEEDDNDDEESEDEDEDDGDKSMIALEALLGNSIVEDDESDEDFVETGEIEDDDDDDISDEDEEEEDDEDDEDEEDEEEEDDDEEEDISTVDRAKQNKNHNESLDSSLEELKEDKRTIFIGNLPKELTKKQLKKHFQKFGNIDTIRLRGIIGKSMKMSKRLAAIKKDIHPRLKSVFAYIKYNSEESAKAALSMNGKVIDGNYIRVDTAGKSDEKRDTKKSVFVGNLSFSVDDNTVRKHFKDCGDIESVRIIRDNKTGIGKGFGYVNFKTEDAAALALELNGTTILNREIRVKACSEQKKKGKRSHSKEEDENSFKKLKNNDEVPVSVRNKENATKRIKERGQKFDVKQTSPQQSSAFEGQKSDGKKKKKSNKLEKKKKLLAEKLAAKPKKPSN